MANNLEKIYDDIDKAIAKKKGGDAPDNSAGRIALFSLVAKDVLAMLQPFLESIIEQTKTTKEELQKIAESISIKVDSPSVTIEPPVVNYTPPDIRLPEIKIPEIKVPAINVPAPVVNIPEFPKEMTVTGLAGLIKTITDGLKGIFQVEVQQDRDKPLNVILCDEKGNHYKATGGGGVVAGVVGPGNSAAHRAMQVAIETVALTVQSTAYPYTIPAGTQRMDFRLRSGDYVFLYSYDNFTNYFTLPAGSIKTIADVNLEGKTLYFKCTEAASQVIEIEILKR